MTTEISVYNFQKIKKSSLEVNGIALVGGHNDNGKTSLCTAVAMALTSESTPAGVTKTAIKGWIHSGEKKGSVRIRANDAISNINWPDCKVTGEGDFPETNEVSAGRIRPASILNDIDRTLVWEDVLGSGKPTDDDWNSFTKDWPESHVKMAKKIAEEHGYDGAHNVTKERVRENKGAWREVTQESWGGAKAIDWVPEGWSSDLDKTTIEELQEEVTNLKKEKSGQEKKNTLSRHRISQLQEEAEKLNDLSKLVPKHMNDLLEIEKKAKELKANLTPIPFEPDIVICCVNAECSQLMGLKRYNPKPGTDEKVRMSLQAVTQKEMDNVQVLRASNAEGTKKIKELGEKYQACKNDLKEAQAKKELAEKAVKELDDLNAEVTDDGGKDEEIDDKILELNKKIEMISKRSRANQINQKISNGIKVIELFDPAKGISKLPRNRSVSKINSELDGLSSLFGMPCVKLDPERLTIDIGEFPYAASSRSMQFRADVVIQVCFANMIGCHMVVIDGADILDKTGRNGLFRMLSHQSFNSLVTMTFNKPELMPDLKKAGLGSCYWIEDGNLSPVN